MWELRDHRKSLQNGDLEKTEYLYFVAEKDGHHRFTKTYAEHLKAIEDIHGPQ